MPEHQDLTHAGIGTLRALLAARDISARELVEHCFRRISALNGELNAVLATNEEDAYRNAELADQAIAQGSAGPLTGIPILHKDLFCTRNLTTTCGSRMLAKFTPTYDATVVKRLDEVGMITLGKANMDEFAMGSSNETSFFGPARNPWDPTRVPGGSSGGSAAAVAAGMVPAASGSDTGGSIRQPAAFCGVTGIKPTYGRISRLGMIAFASSLDQAGPMAGSAADCALLLNAMAGHDPADSTSAKTAVPDFTAALGKSVSGLKIGLPRQYFSEALDPAIADKVHEALAVLEREGAILVDVDLPLTQQAIATYYVIAPAEASTNLARFDGVRFGYRCADPMDLSDLYRRSRSEGFGDEVQRRILVGTYVLSAGFYDAYFKKAQQVRRLIKEDFSRVLSDVDLIAGPTAPGVPFTIGAKREDPLAMYLEDVYTLGASLAGLPAASLPIGQVSGLPVGLQLIGRAFDEATLITAADSLQTVTDWHLQRPDAGESKQ